MLKLRKIKLYIKNYYNIGIAVGTERGLVVPVLKQADEISFADIEKKYIFIVRKS